MIEAEDTHLNVSGATAVKPGDFKTILGWRKKKADVYFSSDLQAAGDRAPWKERGSLWWLLSPLKWQGDVHSSDIQCTKPSAPLAGWIQAQLLCHHHLLATTPFACLRETWRSSLVFSWSSQGNSWLTPPSLNKRFRHFTFWKCNSYATVSIDSWFLNYEQPRTF